MMILIAGRTGTGKDYLAKKLEANGLKQLKSYTTRPKRRPDEDTHIFIDKEVAGQFQKVAETQIGEYTYFATREQVENADVYIVDPKGIKDLTTNMPDTPFLLVYVKADAEEAMEHAVARASDQVAEMRIYLHRYVAENAEFTAMEHILEEEERVAENIGLQLVVKNDYGEDAFNETVKELLGFKRMYDNILIAVEDLKLSGHLTMQNGKILVYQENLKCNAVSDEQFAMEVALSTEGIGTLMSSWLSMPAVNLQQARNRAMSLTVI